MRLFALLAFALIACHDDTPATTPTPTSSASAAVGASGSTSSARSIPKIETTCATDADCVVTSDDIDGATACCPGCTQRAGNTTWYKQFQAACTSSPAPQCPAIGCAMPIVRAACVNHACAAVPPAK